ncbi:zf-LITAF-like domain containing protein, partial [Asbolus verrucosus]
LGPEPIYIWCTHCATVVITVTQSQRSKFTHLTAAALCLFGCWPCAMLPYCMNSCKNIYHYCPDCNYLFGMYRPW